MEITTVPGMDGQPDAALPSARYERKLRALVAEILRHKRVKERDGGPDIHDRALHYRAENITKE